MKDGPRSSDMRTIGVYSGGEILGDGLFKLPFLKDLRRRFPDDRIVWITRHSTVYEGVLKYVACLCLDTVHSNTGLGNSVLHAILPPRPLRRLHFDVLIDTQSVIARSLAAKRLSHDFFVSSAGKFLFSDRKPPRGQTRPAHFLDRMTQILDLAAPPIGALPDLSLVPEDARAAAEVLLPAGPRYIGFAPGAGDPNHRWPLDRFLAVARQRAQIGDLPVFFLGPAEINMLSEIREAIPEARFPEMEAAAWDANGPDGAVPRGPPLVMALAGRLAGALCNDSGPGHMLAAGGTPLVVLYGRHDPAKYQPRGAPVAFLWARDYGGREPACIPVQDVIAALDRHLAAQDSAKSPLVPSSRSAP